jgi:AcrR family transcriptional regulator
MTVRQETSTRERIVSQAIRLFAERGFNGTTVGDIERAAGLAPRSGGLYKHFASKEAVLEAAAERHVSEIEAVRKMIDLRPLGDLRAELTLIARYTLAELRAERPLIKIVQKDGDQFPELMKLVRDRVIRKGHETANVVMGRILAGNGISIDDPTPLASVALATLVGRDLEQMMFQHDPGGLSEEEFIEAWVDLWMKVAVGLAAGSVDGRERGTEGGTEDGTDGNVVIAR